MARTGWGFSFAPGAPRAVAVLVHGFNSHGGYYDWIAGQLTGMGLAAYAPDLRGRGKSDGERYYVDSIDEYVSDVSGDKTLKLYEGHYHDLLNDVGKDRVMADIKAWIGARLPAA